MHWEPEFSERKPLVVQPVEKAIGGKYEILDKIREGGMGAIYKVRHRLLDEIRIIKVLRSELAMDEKLRQRFQNEAKFAIQLRHPHIAHLYDFSVSTDATSAFIVMEYIDGVTLEELIAESGPPTLGLAVEIASQALQAIGYLHQQGFVHRDIAADNLMLTKDFQGDPLVKLIDLGIAKGQEQNLNLTATGVFMGKVRYSAPELFKTKGGAAALDERSDIYSFGILLYQLLTGKSPVSGDSFSEIVAGHLFRPPLPFAKSDPEGSIPDGLRALCLDALEKDRRKRIPSAEAFLERLTRFSGDVHAHSDEFARAMEATTQLATLRPRTSAGPSTQDRLDRQFGVDDPSSPPEESSTATEEAVAQAVSAIREHTRIGELAKASEDLELAVSLYGDHFEFEAVRQELASTRDAGGRKAAAPREAAAPTPDPAPASGDATSKTRPAASPIGVERRPIDPLGRLKSPLGLTLAAALALILGGLALVWWLSGRPATTSGSSSAPLLVEAAPRWSAGGEDQIAFEAAPSLADHPSVREPPAPPSEGGSSGQSEPVSPAPEAEDTSQPVATDDPVASEAGEPDPEPATPAEPTEPAEPESPRPQVRRGELFGPDPGVTPPSLVAVPAAVYPPGFDAPSELLDLMVEVLVSEDGRVITARMAPREPGRKRFKELAVELAKGATFRPATKYGVEGKMWTTIRVSLPPG